MKIQIRAILVIVLTNTVIILLSIFAGTGYVRENIEGYIEADMLVVADIADRFISSELDLLRYEAGEAADSLQTADAAGWEKILAEQMTRYPKFIGMSVISQSSGIAASAGESPADSALLEDEAAQKAFSGEKAFTSTVSVNNETVFYLAVPIVGIPGHILALTLDGVFFSDLASEYHVWDTGHIFIDDKDGYVIANIRPEWVQTRQNFILQAQNDPQYQEVASVVHKATGGERGIGYYSVDGIARICAYRPITGSPEGWCLGIVAPLSESPVRNVDTGLLLIAGVSFLLNIAAAVIASGFIKKPFEQAAALKEAAEADLIENKKMMAGIEQRDKLLQIANQTADLLLRAEPDDFARILRECMSIMARAVGAGSMYLVKNKMENGKLYRDRVYEWLENTDSGQNSDVTVHIAHDKGAPGIREALMRGEVVNMPVSDMTPADRDRLGSLGILSVLLIPVFIRGEFWGFVGLNSNLNERLYTKNEESVMRSGSLLIASALLRNEYMLGLRDTSVKLENALADAERANNAKSSFLAHMSHEIRTPLNAVIGLSELTLGEDRLDGDAKSNLEKISVAGTTILSIVNDILDISKIESGKLEIYPVRYDTPSLINDIVTLNTVRIGEKPITFNLNLDDNLPGSLYGDDLRVKQIFNNLLSNAFKYTESGAVEWRVSFEREGGGVWLISSVRDTGIGMTPEGVSKLFSDYNRVDTEISRKVEGTGLGLAITKRLVELMDGTVTAESEYGKGTVFYVRLRQEVVSWAPIGNEVAQNLMGMRYSLSRRDKNLRLARTDLSYARVLVVDDIATNLDIIKGMLKPYKMEVDCVLSGAQSIEAIRAGVPRYSAVFMDHMMPEMDGIEAARIIREEIGTDYARNIPVIALTANAVVGNEEMFLSKGFQDFISKPIDMAKLDAVLRRWVRDKAMEKEAAGTDEYDKAEDGQPESVSFARGSVTVEGLDIRKGLERFNNDEAVFISVLRSYSVNTPPLLVSLSGYLAAGKLADYSIAVHGIKGSSYGIFARDIGDMAESLEMSAKSGDLNAVTAGHPAFIERAKALINDIIKSLDIIDRSVVKPVAAEPDAAVLQELRDACEAFDMNRIDAAMERLESFKYEKGEKLVVWLREKFLNMDFETIANGAWPSE